MQNLMNRSVESVFDADDLISDISKAIVQIENTITILEGIGQIPNGHVIDRLEDVVYEFQLKMKSTASDFDVHISEAIKKMPRWKWMH